MIDVVGCIKNILLPTCNSLEIKHNPKIMKIFHMQNQGMVKEGEEVALVQSGRQPIWRFQSTHNIQVRKV